MTPLPEPPPAHVRAAFGVRDMEPELIDSGLAWRCGAVVIRPADTLAEATWVARNLGTLKPDNLRIAQPLRSTDGRYVIGGWSATRYLPGQAQPRHDEIIAASLRLHQSTSELPKPRFLDSRDDLFAVADKYSWQPEHAKLDPEMGGRLFELMAAQCKPVELPVQVVHGDLFGKVLFADGLPPAIADFVAYWHPAEWAAAVIAVDALAWGGADAGIVHRWSHIAEWPQMLLRATLFRLAVHAMHPRSTAQSFHGIERVAMKVTELL